MASPAIKFEPQTTPSAISSRAGLLKDRLLSITPEICYERAELITESYKETEGMPVILRRAKALEKILAKMVIRIQPDELIVGNHTPKPRSSPIFPEFSFAWIEAEFDRLAQRAGDVFLISDECKEKLSAVFKYWQGKTTQEYASNLMPADAKAAQANGVFTVGNYFFLGVGHICVDYGMVLQKGYLGIKADVLKEKLTLDLTNPADLKKSQFLQAVEIACDAAISFAARFAAEAEKQAQAETNDQRKQELLAIAANCRKVPANPAQTFYESLQSFWFVQLIIQLESNGHSISPGRFDIYMYPYYKKDIMSGKLTPEQAMELIECLWVKFNEINKVRDEASTKAFGGYPMFQNLIVGGQTADGRDSTNELSYLCLEATENVRLPQPSLSIRFHQGTPQKFLIKSSAVAALGLGMPAMYNDHVIIPSLAARGVSLEDARDYCVIGCVEPQKGGKTEGWHDAAFFSLAKCLELALNDGIDPVTGVQLGLKTGTLATMATFDKVMDAYRNQIEYFVKLLVISNNCCDIAHGSICPLPLLSSMVQDCVAKGKSLQEGGAHYNFTGPQGVGVANVGDALVALKKLVYGEKIVSRATLADALNKNWAGYETERQIMLNQAPKFGNDDDAADELARLAARIYCEEVEKYTNPRGGQFQAGLYPVSANVPLGAVVGALPDGRLAGTPLADGVSPVSGRDIKGPTAAAKSVAKLDHEIASNGTLFNQKFLPNALKGETGLGNLAALIRSYFSLGGLHVQFNVISKETLEDAQRNPEQYRSLVVRVAGYSAFFTSLDRSLQEDIIARTEHDF
ncbi:glycyl radical protein [Sporomusa sp.]|jgi:formate C-acetyltransferase|uniref:glycyl radical protein n=1 Tax=Sporomusa sp. TaxID=2078658 RepID=UPI002B8B8D97|nr:glycyl radical protein [Sporomusa sp.]HWR06187.1 glycyl radical protein [Sporomusa sp.]